MIVVAASIVLGELLNPLQIIGFTMQLIGILMWSLLKAEASSKPAEAENTVVQEDPTQWEALRSDIHDLRPELDTRAKKSGVHGMPTVSSQSTMAPVDDRESEESYAGM